MASYKLLSVSADAKTIKGEKFGYLTGILYLAPAKLSGYEVCPMRSEGCTKACLNTAGRGIYTNVQEARIRKTKRYFEERPAFLADLVADIRKLVLAAAKRNMQPVVRLNGTSDIPWERVPVGEAPNVMALFPEVLFYDYTKIAKRAWAYAHGQLPSNYHLTFSLTENNDAQAMGVIAAGGNVAVVFSTKRGKSLPAGMAWQGEKLVSKAGEYTIPVIDGDESDTRFADMRGCIVGLRAKGDARKDQSGFVRAG